MPCKVKFYDFEISLFVQCYFSQIYYTVSMDNMLWYHSLNKPFLNPPDWLFAPVWTVFYIMMAFSFILFLKSRGENKAAPATLFLSQLALNLIWSPVFFGNMNPKSALIVIILLIIALVWTIAAFYKYSKTAALLLVPYLIWVLFAAYLNFEIVRLNLYV